MSDGRGWEEHDDVCDDGHVVVWAGSARLVCPVCVVRQIDRLRDEKLVIQEGADRLRAALASSREECERLKAQLQENEDQCAAWMRKRDRAYAERDAARAEAFEEAAKIVESLGGDWYEQKRCAAAIRRRAAEEGTDK
jgi:hypothetical protein